MNESGGRGHEACAGGLERFGAVFEAAEPRIDEHGQRAAAGEEPRIVVAGGDFPAEKGRAEDSRSARAEACRKMLREYAPAAARKTDFPVVRMSPRVTPLL